MNIVYLFILLKLSSKYKIQGKTTVKIVSNSTTLTTSSEVAPTLQLKYTSTSDMNAVRRSAWRCDGWPRCMKGLWNCCLYVAWFIDSWMDRSLTMTDRARRWEAAVSYQWPTTTSTGRKQCTAVFPMSIRFIWAQCMRAGLRWQNDVYNNSRQDNTHIALVQVASLASTPDWVPL